MSNKHLQEVVMSVVLYNQGGVDFLATIKNGLVTDIACSKVQSLDLALGDSTFSCPAARTKVKVKDLALYTHWPQHTKEFWDLLNET